MRILAKKWFAGYFPHPAKQQTGRQIKWLQNLPRCNIQFSKFWSLMDLKNKLLFLTPAIAVLAVGTYLISTTYLITRDGPLYIEQAQQFGQDPITVIKNSYFGYPFLIFATHKISSVFGAGNSFNSWIISAQAVSLFCMLVSFVPLYFIGKSFIGSGNSLYALIILAFLPYPVRFGCDVLRDWPYILFLSLSFAALIAAAKGKKWWLYGASGLLAGLGYLIKVDCGQIIIYALVWLGLCAIRPRYLMTRKKAVLSALLLLACFTAIVLPYMHVKQQFVPEKIQEQMNETSSAVNTTVTLTPGKVGGLTKSIINVFKRTGENLFYYFFVFALIGFCSRFIADFKKITDIEKTFVISFIALNVIMLTWVSYGFGYLSRRHCLPLSLFFLFYVPVGLKIVGEKLNTVFAPSETSTSRSLAAVRKCLSVLGDGTIFWLHLLLIVGIIICLPTLLEPKRKDLTGFLDAAYWLDNNTTPADLIVVPDERISFYAQRMGLQVWEKKDLVASGANFAVAQVNSKESIPNWGEQITEFWVNPKKKDDKLIIYKLK